MYENLSVNRETTMAMITSFFFMKLHTNGVTPYHRYTAPVTLATKQAFQKTVS
jgi:hypothetical protein